MEDYASSNSTNSRSDNPVVATLIESKPSQDAHVAYCNANSVTTMELLSSSTKIFVEKTSLSHEEMFYNS